MASNSALVEAADLSLRCRQKFLRFFPDGFRDETYLDWERGYKYAAHRRWKEVLDRAEHRRLLRSRKFTDIADCAVRIEARTNLLFSFEKMALRDALKTRHGAQSFSEGLYEFAYGAGSASRRFERWCEVVAGLPRKQTRVLTWPVVTVFPFIVRPDLHIFFKPKVTRIAAREYGFDLQYTSRPSWPAYASLLQFAAKVRRDLRSLSPRDMVDIQSFMWVLGSDEYEE
jgi:hypothetical protein